MIDFLLYWVGPLLVGVWWRSRPKPKLSSLLGLWWAGLFLMRILPPLLMMIFGRGRGPGPLTGALLEAVIWIGAVLLLRALLGLTSWERTTRLRTRVALVFLALSFLMTGLLPDASAGLPLLAIPWLWSFRWRGGLTAGPLALASLSAIVSVVLALLRITPSSSEGFNLTGFVTLSNQTAVLAAIYALLSFFAVAGRIHLSIRRIGTRLVSSHILAGVVPFVLGCLFLILGGALFLSTYRGSIGARLLQESSREAEAQITGGLTRTGRIDAEPFGKETPGQIVILRADNGPARATGGLLAFSPDTLLNCETTARESPVLWDGETLYLRARVDTLYAERRLRIEALVPVDSLRMSTISRLIGVPVRVNPFQRVQTLGGDVQIGPEAGSGDGEAIGPPKTRARDLPGGAIISCLRRSETGWTPMTITVTSSAALSEPLLSLFQIARENPLAWVVLIALGVIAIFIVGAIWITIGMVIQMGRSITRAVHALTHATAELREGRLGHRIEIADRDELWSVAASFNEMAEGLERMRAVERETHRLEEELRLAREIQTRLLPAGPPTVDGLELAGMSLSARQVGGDYYDYLVLDHGQVGLAIADVSGKGAPAALLMSSFRASLRTQDLLTLGPAEVLGRLNRFIHQSVDPGKFITAFLAVINPATGEIRYANAGHDPPLVVRPSGAIEELTGGGLILGMLPQIAYDEATAVIEYGSLIAVFTDGVTESQNPQGEFFGVERIVSSLRESKGRPCEEVVRRILKATQDFAGTASQFDDITMIIARRNDEVVG